MHAWSTHTVVVALLGALLGAVYPVSRPGSAALTEVGIEREGAALVEAMAAGDRQTGVLLLAAGCSPDERDGDGRTALMISLGANDPAMAVALIEAGSDLQARDDNGESVLAYAIRAGEVSIVKNLLDRGVAADAELATMALESGRTASAWLMSEAGILPEGHGMDGTPAVFHAVRRGRSWLLGEILANGTDIEVSNGDGESLVHAAARHGDRTHARILWAHGARADWKDREDRTALHVAAGSGNAEFAAELIARGAPVGWLDAKGWAPIHLAARHGSLGCMETLLEAGAVATVEGPAGRTPFDIAVSHRHFPVAQLLRDRGCEPGAHLHAAVIAGDDELFDFLMRNGADPNLSQGETPLIAAVRAGGERFVRGLLEAGAEVDATGPAGQKPFHLAMAMGDHAIVRSLLAHGADVNEPFSDGANEEFLERVAAGGYIKWHLAKDRGVTPLMMAADRGDLALAGILMEHGARTDVCTGRYKYWPIVFASRNNDVRMMKLLLKRDPHRDERWIKVDLSEQMAWVYDESGQTLFSTSLSSGKEGYRTKTGEFVITNRNRHHVSNIYKGAIMPYFQRLSCGDFGFHQGVVPGYPASHGCLRVPAGKAYGLWDCTQVGDKVVIVE